MLYTVVSLSKNCQNKKIINGILSLDKNKTTRRNIPVKFVLKFFKECLREFIKICNQIQEVMKNVSEDQIPYTELV